MKAHARSSARDRIAALAERGLSISRRSGASRPKHARARRAALHVALLVHVRPGLAAGHQPLPGRARGGPVGVARRTSTTRTTSTRWPRWRARSAASRRCTRRPAATPAAAPRWHANMQIGGDQELLLALRTRAGDAWGMLGLYREPGEPLLRRTTSWLPARRRAAPRRGRPARAAARRGHRSGGPRRAGAGRAQRRLAVESLTPGVERWLAELPDGDWEQGRLPPAVLAVAGRALRTAEAPDAPGEVAVARVLSRVGPVGGAARRLARRRRRRAGSRSSSSPPIRRGSRRC